MIASSPYPGIRPFYRNETDIFFGREQQVDQLLEKLNQSRFLAVLGPSGCGKSSLVRAGLINALETGFLTNTGACWRIAEMRPGTRPLMNLAVALMDDSALGTQRRLGASATDYLHSTLRRGPLGLLDLLRETPLPEHSNLLLLVDQFEEIFRYRKDSSSDEADAFVALLLATSAQREAPIYVVITMRSDFLGDCARFYGLPEALNDSQFLTPRLTREQQRAAIEGPAVVFGGEVDSALVNRLLNDMGSNPDQLPLMQHLMMRMWSIKTKTTECNNASFEGEMAVDPNNIILTLEDYNAAGGLSKALSNHADSLYEYLNEEQKAIAEVLFRCLSERSADQRDTRRPVRLNVIASVANVSPEQLSPVVEVFRSPGCSFITPPAGTDLHPETILDISHESLIRKWEKMNQWVEHEARSAETYRRLEQTACLWKEGKAALWSTPDLENALTWKEREKPTPLWAKRYSINFELAMEFLDASKQKREKQQQEEEAMRQRELKRALALAEEQKRRVTVERERFEEQASTNRKLRRFAISLGIVSLLALGAAVFALIQWEKAKQQTRLAQTRELTKAANTNLNIDPARSVSLALQAVSITRSANKTIPNEAIEALHRAVQASRVRLILIGHSDVVYRLDFSPDGKRLATASRDGTAKVWDTASGKNLITIQDHREGVYGIAFSPDGTRLATASDDSTAKIWDAESGQEFLTLLGHTDGVLDIAFSPDGTCLATASRDNSIKLWDAFTGDELFTLYGHKAWVYSLDFSPDGQRLATASRDGTAKVLDTRSGRMLFTLQGHTYEVLDVVFSPDGTCLATASRDNTVKLWDAKGGQLIYSILVHLNGVWGVNFSPDGKKLATASLDGTAKVWDITSRQLIYTLHGHKNQLTSVIFNLDGTRLATACADGTVRLWINTSGEELPSLSGHTNDVMRVEFSPDGRLIGSADIDGKAIVWDTRIGQEILVQKDSCGSVAFSPDGQRFATGGFREAKVWDTATGQQLLTLTCHFGWIDDVKFSPNGLSLATCSSDGTAKIWDITSGKELLSLSGHRGAIEDFAFSPNGQRLATICEDRMARFWDTSSGKELLSVKCSGNPRAIAFSPDGKQLATGGTGRIIQVWDTATGDELLILSGHTDTIRGIIFSLDETRLISAGWDGRIIIWDTASGKKILSLTDNQNPIYNIALSHDGRYLAAACEDKPVRLYAMDIDDLMALARTRIEGLPSFLLQTNINVSK